MRKLFFLISIVCFSIGSIAQSTTTQIIARKSLPLQTPCKGLLTGLEKSDTWPIRLQDMESEENAFPKVKAMKEKMMIDKKQSVSNSFNKIEANGQVTPVLSTNFTGNLFDGSYPSDNTIAISNGGKIVSVINSNIAYFTTSGTKTFSQDITQFTNDNSVSSTIFDPKVLYDAGADRFFMVELAGYTVGNSDIQGLL